MFLKLVSLIGVLIVLALALLVMRQQRLEYAHDIADRHQSVQRHRQAIWDQQVRNARLLRPSELRPRLDSTPVALEPATERPVRTRLQYADGSAPTLPPSRIAD